MRDTIESGKTVVSRLESFKHWGRESSCLLDADDVQRLGLNPARPNAMLCDDFEFEINGIRCVIPVGYVSDLGSIPRGLWNLISPVDARARMAYFIHDWGCENEGVFIRADKQGYIALKKAALDALTLRALESGGVPFIARRLTFRAIRLFGPRYKIK